MAYETLSRTQLLQILQSKDTATDKAKRIVHNARFCSTEDMDQDYLDNIASVLNRNTGWETIPDLLTPKPIPKG